MQKRRLPVGIQDFEYIRKNDFVYVDKTRYVYELAARGKPYFLSRPRRFGKSLLLSAMKYYFEGRKELFTGLALADIESEWVKYPVFHLDMNAGDYRTVEGIKSSLESSLRTIENDWKISSDDDVVSKRFELLIKKVHAKTGRQVVVLVDEYDKPLLTNIEKGEINDDIRIILKSFYGVLKAADQYLRFAFLTGVTKFSKVSVFSDLNQLQDISFDNDYADICGITEKELIEDFDVEIHALAEENGKGYDETLALMRKNYNGYHFSKKSESVYNPFSVLNVFTKRDFGYYWYSTGTPTFLVEMLKTSDIEIPNLIQGISCSLQRITDYRIGETDPVPLLYQTGYLTIKSCNELTDMCVLGFPNDEVKYGFLDGLLASYLPRAADFLGLFIGNFIEDLQKDDIAGFMKRLNTLFMNLPYGTRKPDEHYFHSFVYLVFTMMGQYAQAEVHTAAGRADAVLFFAGKIYVFEFKAAQKGKVEEAAKAALTQINEKGYTAPYLSSGKDVVKIGAAFVNDSAGGQAMWWTIEENRPLQETSR